MFSRYVLVFTCALLLVSPNARSDADFIDSGVLEGNDMLESGLEISGLLMNETLTKFGQDLFDAFKRAWRPPQGVSYNIAIGERFDPARGSLISVRLNDGVIYEGFMPPRAEAIQTLGTNLAKEIRLLLQRNVNLEETEFYWSVSISKVERRFGVLSGTGYFWYSNLIRRI